MKPLPPLPDKADLSDYQNRTYALLDNNRELSAQILAKGGTPPKMPTLLNAVDPIEKAEVLDAHRISLEAVLESRLSPATAPAISKPSARAEATAPHATAAAAPVAATGMTLTQMCAVANKTSAPSERFPGETLTAYCARVHREQNP